MQVKAKFYKYVPNSSNGPLSDWDEADKVRNSIINVLNYQESDDADDWIIDIKDASKPEDIAFIDVGHKHLAQKDFQATEKGIENYLDYLLSCRKQMIESKKTELQDSNSQGESHTNHLPLFITIGCFDYFGVLSHSNSETLIKSDSQSDELYETVRDNIDGRIHFLDASVWHRYFPREVFVNPDNDDIRPIKEVCEFEFIKSIKKNLKGLFGIHSPNAQHIFQPNEDDNLYEYLDYASRFQSENHLSIFTNTDSHAKHITPMLQHSEGYMAQQLAEKAESSGKDNGIEFMRELRWHFLIVEDKIKTDDDDNMPIKQQAIENAFQHLSEKLEKNKDDDFIKKTYARNIEEAKNAVYEKSYDIILLDYLLPKKGEGNKRELGYEFIKYLKEQNQINENQKNPEYYPGPFRSMWIFPITVFHTSFIDKLQQEGESDYSIHWYISRGADPLNTPNLFAHDLFLLMQELANKIVLRPDEMIDFFNKGLLGKNENIDDPKEFEYKCRKLLNRFMFLFGSFEMLTTHSKEKRNSKDDPRSQFASSVMDYFKNNPNSVQKTQLTYHRIRKLLYMLAYRNYGDVAEISNAIEAVKESVIGDGDGYIQESKINEFKQKVLQNIR